MHRHLKRITLLVGITMSALQGCARTVSLRAIDSISGQAVANADVVMLYGRHDIVLGSREESERLGATSSKGEIQTTPMSYANQFYEIEFTAPGYYKAVATWGPGDAGVVNIVSLKGDLRSVPGSTSEQAASDLVVVRMFRDSEVNQRGGK